MQTIRKVVNPSTCRQTIADVEVFSSPEEGINFNRYADDCSDNYMHCVDIADDLYAHVDETTTCITCEERFFFTAELDDGVCIDCQQQSELDIADFNQLRRETIASQR